MNFFEHQERARASTTKLVLLFIVAILVLVVITSYAITIALLFVQHEQRLPDFNLNLLQLDIFLKVGVVIVGIVLVAALFRLAQLRTGGRAIAEQMKGRLLLRNGATAEESRILNVVEEMAIASGLPVPPVYLIPDDAINAFAAGFHARDAIVGITQGAIRYLKREELQGVIAHEFSHILNGDMRLNLRLVAWLHGLVVLALIGKQLLYIPRTRRTNSRDRSGELFILLGVVLLVLGYAGVFFGNLIKAAVSRQREFLADASGVQFTRYPEGLGNALKKIGGYPLGSRLMMPEVEEISHMMFSDGLLRPRKISWFATHPDLKERIRRIEPRWRSEFINPFQLPEAAYSAIAEEEGETLAVDATAKGVATALAATVIASVGEPTVNSGAIARAHVLELPALLRVQLDDPQGVVNTIYALLVANSANAMARAQIGFLQKQLPTVEFTLFTSLLDVTKSLAKELHYAVIELAQPGLQQLSSPQRQQFQQRLSVLIAFDGDVSFFEWCLQKLVNHNLSYAGTAVAASFDLASCTSECSELLAVMAEAGQEAPSEALAAWLAACEGVGIRHDPVSVILPTINASSLDAAISKLSAIKPLQKPKLLKALVICIEHDGQITAEELALLRLTAALLDCPIPPLASLPLKSASVAVTEHG